MMRVGTGAMLVLMMMAGSPASADLVASPKPASGKTLPFAPPPPPPPMADESVVCATDVRLCADGSYVRRNPATGCSFDLCPGPGSRT